MDKEAESAARYARRAVELAPSNEETVSLLQQIQKRLEPDGVCWLLNALQWSNLEFSVKWFWASYENTDC